LIPMTGNDLILDTSTIVDYFKKIPLVTTNIKRAERVFIPPVVAGELYFGVERSAKQDEKKQEVEEFLSTDIILPIDLNTARIYGIVRAGLAKKGKTDSRQRYLDCCGGSTTQTPTLYVRLPFPRSRWSASFQPTEFSVKQG